MRSYQLKLQLGSLSFEGNKSQLFHILNGIRYKYQQQAKSQNLSSVFLNDEDKSIIMDLLKYHKNSKEKLRHPIRNIQIKENAFKTGWELILVYDVLLPNGEYLCDDVSIASSEKYDFKQIDNLMYNERNGKLVENKDFTYIGRNQSLKNIGYDSYKDYLKSSLWKDIRKKVFKNKGKICILCQTNKATTIHHRRYSVIDLMGDDLTFLEPVCNECHDWLEFSIGGDKLNLIDTNKKLAETFR